jgi:hypothetical protein
MKIVIDNIHNQSYIEFIQGTQPKTKAVSLFNNLESQFCKVENIAQRDYSLRHQGRCYRRGKKYASIVIKAEGITVCRTDLIHYRIDYMIYFFLP